MRTWTPTTIRGLRGRLGMTQAQFAAKLGVSLLTIHRWERKKEGCSPSPMATRLLNRLEQIENGGEI